MPRFTVIWDADAVERLCEVWLAAADRGDVSRASDLIEDRLSIDPQAEGLPLHEGLRSFEQAPLRVIFEVDNDDRRCRVLAVSRLADD